MPATQPSPDRHRPAQPPNPVRRRASAAIFLALLASCFAIFMLAVPSLARSNRSASIGAAPAQTTQSPDHNPNGDRPTPDPRQHTVGEALPYDTNPQSHGPSPDRTGGPDAYGYVFADERDPGGPVFQWQPGSNRVPDSAWVSISGYNSNDDGVVTTTLPFSFTLYGVSYSVMHIGTNGNVHFGPPTDNPPSSSTCLPSNSQYVPQAMAAPLWQDLVVPLTSEGNGGVYTDVIGTAPNRTYVVEWRQAYDYYNHNATATFEALLTEDGTIYFQYNELTDPDVQGQNAVVGIQNGTGTIGLPYDCHPQGPDLVAGRAIRYNIPAAVIFSPSAAQRGGAPGTTLVYTETLLNQTGITNSFTIAPSGNVWTTTVQPPNTGNMSTGSSLPVTISVQIPASATLGMSDTELVNVSSELPTPGAYTATARLSSSVSSYGVDFAPPEQRGSGDYGSVVTYTARLYNRSGIVNNFDLQVAGNPNWATNVYPSNTGSMQPNASVQVTITVYVPPGTSLGDADNATIEAIGQLPQQGTYFGAIPVTTYAGEWHRRALLPTGRSRGAAVTFAPNGRIYAIGGEFNNGNTDPPILEYDPIADTWTARSRLQVGVNNIGAAVIGNAVYIPGGYNSGSGYVQNILQVYYPLEDRVAVVATDPLPQPRLGAGVAAYNGKLYVIGGSSDSLHAANTVYEYDPNRPAGSRWQSKASMPTARFYLGAATISDAIYAVGGLNENATDLDVVEAYHPQSDTWTTVAPLNIGRAAPAVLSVDYSQPGCGGYLYALGGGWTNYTDTVERYNPATNSWIEISPLSEPRRSLYAAYSTSTFSLIAFGGWSDTYQALSEAVSCSGGVVPLTPTPTVPTTPTVPATPTVWPTTCPLQFSDVPSTDPFYPYIRCLVCRGIISGYNDNTFRPNNNITRGQLSKIVANSANFNDSIPTTRQTYTDVPYTNTFWLWVERLTLHGAIGGYSDNTFRPFNNATRGQISKIVANAAGYSDTPTGQTFEDVRSSDTFYLEIERLASRGIMGGYACGGAGEPCVPPTNKPYFRPSNNATRGQVSKIVANTFFPNCNPPR